MIVKQVAQQLVDQNLKVHSVTDWKEYEDGDIDLGNGYHVQVGFDYLTLTKNEYDKQGELSAVRFILEETDVNGIVRYFWEKE